MVEISLVGGVAFAGLAIALLLLAWIHRIRARVRGGVRPEPRPEPRPGTEAGNAAMSGTASPSGPRVETGSRPESRLEPRLEAIETRLARLAAEMAEGSSEARLRDMAGSLIGLIRDKNATLETALAGLDQLRARLRAVERIGDVAEARALFEELGGRLGTLEAAQMAQAAGTEAGLAGLRATLRTELRAEAEAAEAPREALLARIARLSEQKDAGLAALAGQFAPLEARLGRIEAERAAEEGARAGQETALGPLREIAERLAGLHTAREALANTLLARLRLLEDRLGAQDPRAALDGLATRLGAVEARAEGVAEGAARAAEALTEALARAAAEAAARAAGAETRLADLSGRLGAVETGIEAGIRAGASEDPFAGITARLDALEALFAADRAARPDEEIQAARLAQSVAQTIEARLTPLEAQFTRLGAQWAPLRARLDRLEAQFDARAAAGWRSAEEAEARAEARAIATGLVAEQSTLFANRLALLEASLPAPAARGARGLAEGSGPRAGSAAESGGESGGDAEPPFEPWTGSADFHDAAGDPEEDSIGHPGGHPGGDPVGGLAEAFGDASAAQAARNAADDAAEAGRAAAAAREADLAAVRNMPRIVSLHGK